MTVEGFDDAVDGYRDVADQLRDYLLSRASDACAGHRETVDDLDSVGAFEARRDRVRERFLDAVGGLPGDGEGASGPPDVPEPVGVEHAGTVDGDGYAVERVVLETLEDWHVTATCYVPDGDGPRPAVLLAPGHHPFPKADAANQRACIALARAGVAALVFDPPGAGERDQYPDAVADDPTDPGDDGVHPVFHGSGVYAHSYAGQNARYAGGNVARWVVHDARCALTVLAGRDDVDADRLGVAGTSGGGMLATYLALVDGRPAAVAACCWVCDREHSMRAGFPVDHEQVLHGALPDDVGAPTSRPGVGVVDLATGLAPTPLCVGAAASDFFPIEGVHDAYDRIEHVYGLCDAADACELRVADCGHAAVSEIPGVLEFLVRELDADPEPAFEPIPEDALHERETLQCTPAGSVLDAYDDERTLTDLVAAFVERDQKSSDDVAPEAVRERVRDRLALDRGPDRLHPRVVARDAHDGLAVRRLFWKSEYDPDVVVAGVLVVDPAATDGDATGGPGSLADELGALAADDAAPAVVAFEDGTAELPERGDDLAALAREHGAALAVDPRGVGATRQRETPATWGDPDYHGVYGTTDALAAHATLLGDSLFGMTVHDVLTASRVVRERLDADATTYVGDGVGASRALYAAAADPATAAVALDDRPPSFRDRATTDAGGFEPRLDARDVLDCDVPRIVAALEADGVAVATDRR